MLLVDEESFCSDVQGISVAVGVVVATVGDTLESGCVVNAGLTISDVVDVDKL